VFKGDPWNPNSHASAVPRIAQAEAITEAVTGVMTGVMDCGVGDRLVFGNNLDSPSLQVLPNRKTVNSANTDPLQKLALIFLAHVFGPSSWSRC
jgi:hypothetical protein